MSPRQQRCAVAAAILGVHTLVVGLLLQSRHALRSAPAQDERLIYLTDLAPPPPPARPQPGALHSRPSAAQPSSAAPASPEARASAITLPQEPARIDWDLAAVVAADDLVDEILQHEGRKCDDSDKPGSGLPKCKKPRSHFEWSEEPKRAGFENGLPYVRLGKHCILILGLVGCALGAEPAANGHLFDDLKDPDRDRSSVPDIADINEPVDAAPRHPSSVVNPARADSSRR